VKNLKNAALFILFYMIFYLREGKTLLYPSVNNFNL